MPDWEDQATIRLVIMLGLGAVLGLAIGFVVVELVEGGIPQVLAAWSGKTEIRDSEAKAGQLGALIGAVIGYLLWSRKSESSN